MIMKRVARQKPEAARSSHQKAAVTQMLCIRGAAEAIATMAVKVRM
jgi:hypothetical protein